MVSFRTFGASFQNLNRRTYRASLVVALASVAAAPLLAQDGSLLRLNTESVGTESTYVPVSPGAIPDSVDQPAEAGDSAEPLARRSSAADATDTGTDPAARTTAAQRAAAQPGETDPEQTASLTAARSQGVLQTEALRNSIQTSGRVQALESRPRSFEETPYSPIGLRTGNFEWFPSIETGVTATNNAASSSGGGSALLSETTLRLNARSDWARHSATLDGFGTFRKTLSGEEVEDVEAGIVGDLRLDLTDFTRLNARAAYSASPESATSPVVIEGTLSEPTRQVIEASLGLEQDIGALRLGGTGRIEREVYGDADLSTGGTLSQGERDSTLYAFALRTGYEVSPALTPFIEAEIGQRIYDEDRDSAGYDRAALRTALKGGVEIDITEKLAGELSAGWVGEDFDDDRLDSLSGAIVEADLTWSPQRGTDINLNAGTIVEGSTSPGEEGSILYSAALTATRELRANLTGTALIGLGFRDYGGSDAREVIVNSELGLTYWLNRNVGVTGRGRYERLASNLEGRDSDTASVFLGLRLQR